MLNFESVNCDGKHIKWEFNTPNEVHRLFWSDTCPLPSNDDPIVHAELDGKPLPQCKAFLDLLRMLGLDEEQYPPEKGKTHKLIAIDLDNTLVAIRQRSRIASANYRRNRSTLPNQPITVSPVKAGSKPMRNSVNGIIGR